MTSAEREWLEGGTEREWLEGLRPETPTAMTDSLSLAAAPCTERDDGEPCYEHRQWLHPECAKAWFHSYLESEEGRAEALRTLGLARADGYIVTGPNGVLEGYEVYVLLPAAVTREHP